MNTKANIDYFNEEWAGGVPLPKLSKANQDAYETVRELTENFSDMDMIEADPAFEKMFGYLCDALRQSNGEKTTSSPKKKSQSAASKARAARTVKSGRGKRQVKRTRKADTTSFAERMKAARAAKNAAKAETKESTKSSARSTKKSAAGAKQSTAKTPKAKGPTKADVADQAYDAAEKSGSVSEEVKQIRKFISLVKKSTKEQLINAVKALNRVVGQRKITKQSPYAQQIEDIQKMLIDAAKKSPYKIRVDESDLAQLVKIAGGHRVYKSVDILTKFISWGETERTAEQAKAFLKQIEKALPRIKADDPYAAEVKQVVKMLSQIKSKTTFHLVNTNLSGLSGLLGCLCDAKKGSGLSGLCESEPAARRGDARPGVARPATVGHVPAVAAAPVLETALPVKKRFPSVMSAHEVAAINYPTYQFKNDPETNDWGTLIGQPQNPFAMMISGEPGAGKSTLMMQLAVYLSRNFGPTRYVSSEEYPSLTLADKLERAGGAVRGLSFSKDLSDLSKDIKFLIVDSTNHVKITLSEFLQLRAKYPGMSFILIMQYTKQGQFKGGNEWPHEVDAVFRVVNSPVKGTVVTDKNRFVREPGQILVFKDLD